MRVSVKVCGITSSSDAAACVAAGCQGLGFVFYRRSPRYLAASAARRICAGLPPGIQRIGVFVNARPARVRAIARTCRLTMLQFHGDESPAYCRGFRGYRVIKAIRLRSGADLEKALAYSTYGLLFDSYHPLARGGTGRPLPSRLMQRLARLRRGHKLFLAGGLTAATVADAVRTVRPDWVDVSSGVEASAGRKDPLKVRAFIARARART